MTRSQQRFAAFAWGVLAYNILVIVWGAYVRASFSGDGCGDHWPFCNGVVIPHAAATKTIVEFTHRMMTGIDTPLIAGLCWWAFRAFPRKHAARLFAVWSVIFLVLEALLGAGLVLFKYVANDASLGRAIYLSAHLTNTMLLLSALTITAWIAYSGASGIEPRSLPRSLQAALPVTLIVSITGGITALGDTLFPAKSLASGMQQDFSTASSLLLRLRVIHPAIAVAGAAYLLYLVVSLLRGPDESHARTAATRVLWIVLAQIGVGVLNISLLAPIWLQLLHLFIADLLWIAVLVMILECAVVSKPAGSMLDFRVHA